jgi:hypothetical protein
MAAAHGRRLRLGLASQLPEPAVEEHGSESHSRRALCSRGLEGVAVHQRRTPEIL